MHHSKFWPPMTGWGHSRHSCHPGVSGSPQERTFGLSVGPLSSSQQARSEPRATLGSRARAQQLVRWHDVLLALGLGQGDGDILDRGGQAAPPPSRSGGRLHHHDQHLGMRARVIGAEQSSIFCCAVCSRSSTTSTSSGSSSTSMRRPQSAQGERVTGERSSGALRRSRAARRTDLDRSPRIGTSRIVPRTEAVHLLLVGPDVRPDTDRGGCYPSVALPAGGIT